MYFSYKTYLVDYEYIYNQNNETIVFLHGWGGNKHSFNYLKKYLETNYNILSISLPPYFLSKNQSSSILSLTIFDYADMVEDLIKLHNITTPNIICHSFGFRIALILSANMNLKSIIITGGAGIKIKKSIIEEINLNQKIILNKYHHLPFKQKSNDYSLLKFFIDKQTFKNIIKVDLKKYVKYITCPTFLFWGKKDKDTNMKIFKFLKKNIKNCKYNIVNSGHFAYLDFNKQFVNKSLNFLRSL